MNENKKNSVLIVDDDRGNLITLTQILEPEFEVHAAVNGQDAIELAEENLPDVILLDILMPEMDGYEVLNALKTATVTRNIPIIFLTGLSKTEEEEKGLALGASDYITKPFSEMVVKLRVRNQVKIINQTRQIIENERMIIEKEHAEKSQQNKIEFLLRMSHEMLTPMNTIMGMAQMLNRPGDLNERRDCVEEIDSSSRQLMQLINDLLDLSDDSDAAFTLESTALSFNKMLRDLLKGIERDLNSKQQTLTFEIDPTIPVFLKGDKTRLAQVFINLLINAKKFIAENGKIHLSAYVQEEDSDTVTIKVEITDDGIGISKEKQTEIFKVFNQVDGSITAQHGGVGLGLPVSKRIIEMMGGKIWVESELGVGAKFAFTFKLERI